MSNIVIYISHFELKKLTMSRLSTIALYNAKTLNKVTHILFNMVEYGHPNSIFSNLIRCYSIAHNLVLFLT